MSKKIEFNGQIHRFPDDFTDAQIQQELQSVSKGRAETGHRKITIYLLLAALAALLVLAAISLRRTPGDRQTHQDVKLLKTDPKPVLNPVPPPPPVAETTFVLDSNLENPILSLDGKEHAMPHDEVRIPGTGDHKAIVSFTKTGETVIAFHSAPDLAPEVNQISPARNSIVAVVSIFGLAMKVYGAPPYATVKFKDEDRGKTAGAGLPIEIPQDGGTLIISSGKQERRIAVAPSNAPRIQILVLGEVDYGAVVILTPDVDDATVFINDQALKNKTRKGRLHLSSLLPGTFTFRVEHGTDCIVGPDTTQTVTLKAGDQKEASFVLKPPPGLRIENAPDKAQFSVPPDTQWYPVSQILPLQPGRHSVVVRAQEYLPDQRVIDVACGPEFVSFKSQMKRDPNYRDPKLIPPKVISKARLSYALTPPTAQAEFNRGNTTIAAGSPVEIEPGSYRVRVSAEGYEAKEENITFKEGDNPIIRIDLKRLEAERTWPAGCLRKTGEWQEAANVCFFGGGTAPGTYHFEVQGRTEIGKTIFGAKKVVRYGPWFVGTPENHVECQVEGDTFRWRKAGAPKWVDASTFKQPVNVHALRVVLEVEAGQARVSLNDGGSADPVTSNFPVPGDGFGLKKGTPIRGFHYSK